MRKKVTMLWNKTERILKKRVPYFEEIKDCNLSELIFIDESGDNLSMSREYGRAYAGSRLKLPKPHHRGSKCLLISTR